MEEGPATIFVALARLTAEPDPLPLQDLAAVEVRRAAVADDPDEAHAAYDRSVRWRTGPERRFRFLSSADRPSAVADAAGASGNIAPHEVTASGRSTTPDGLTVSDERSAAPSWSVKPW
ncbi:hypothetical protein QA802_33360 [Streptomyces sp. B21-105]|uniref:hypothetical protein n=1 Tax=Streptomyces sp. B21-105 TaxID=3039417 RepID=UPI002FF35192